MGYRRVVIIIFKLQKNNEMKRIESREPFFLVYPVRDSQGSFSCNLPKKKNWLSIGVCVKFLQVLKRQQKTDIAAPPSLL